MRFFRPFGVLLALCVGLCACDTAERDIRFDGVVRILMHEPGEFTLLLENPETHLVTEQKIYNRGAETTYVLDVPPDRPMWAKVHFVGNEGITSRRRIEFHLHSVDDVNGAGWTRQVGKTTQRGQTEVIQ